MGMDWRENDPAQLAIGPVLSLEDAVGNKVAAVYSRGEPRNFADLDAIRRWGGFTDQELVTEAAKRDPGFEIGQFADQLTAVNRLTHMDVARYGIDAHQLEAIKDRCLQWAERLHMQTERSKATSPELDVETPEPTTTTGTTPPTV